MARLVGGKYELLECLGRGGTGNVYRAVQRPLDRVVAIKVLRPEMGRDLAVRRRFAREARSVAALNHPNITTVFDFGVADDESLFLAMEFIDGHSLRTLIDQGLPTIPTLIVVEQVLAGLAHAHARGLIHRDLKPGNVLVSHIDDQLRAKIVDFGIAGVADGAAEGGGPSARVIGTPRYMSPEQAQGSRNLGPATDLYNVGLMLYESAAGRHPFTAKTPQAMMLQHCTAPVSRPLPRPGFLLPERLERIILRCLAKNPSERFPSAAALRGAVESVRRSLEDKGHSIFLPVAPAQSRDTEGRITLVEGAPRVVSARRPQMAHALDVPFVGRGEEKRFIAELGRRVYQEGRGAIVIVEGEIGVGKTRLVTWFKEQVVEQGTMRSLAGRYLREGRGGLRGLREAVEQLFGARGLSEAEASARVASQMVSWNLTDARETGLLIRMLRPRMDDGDEEGAAPNQLEHLMAVLIRALEAAAEVQPVLLLLDDIQWAGAQTAEFIGFLASEMRSRDLRLLLLCTLRSEELADNPSVSTCVSNLAVHAHDHVFRLRLGPMDDGEIGHLIAHVLPAHESLVSAIIRRAQGNPLYALQILRYLIDEELIAPTDTGRYMATEEIRVEALVPPNLADLLMLRLSQLERRGNRARPLTAVLERAAILGSRFPYETLVAMVSADELLDESALEVMIDDLVDEGLLCQVLEESDDVVEFRHTMVRDVLVKRLAPRRTTRRLHRLAAEAKRAHFEDRLQVVARQLAEHYELGHVFDEALRYCCLAGRTAEQMHRPPDAADAWRRFLRIAPRVDDARRAELGVPAIPEVEVRLGELEEALGWYDQAEATFRRLLPGEERALDTPARIRAAIGLANVARKQGRAVTAEELYQRAIVAAKAIGTQDLLGVALLGLAKVHWHHGEARLARERGELARRVAEESGDVADEANALWFLGDIARLTGDLDLAETHFRSALTCFESLDDPRGRARCLYGLALVARGSDDLDGAFALYRQAYDTLEPLGIRRGLGHCLNGLGEVARFRNRLSEARDYYRRAVDIYQSASLVTDAAVSLTNLGLVARDSGDLEGARDAMERALKVAEAARYRYLTLGIAVNLGWVYALMGERELCQRMLDDHLGRAQEVGLADPDFARPLEGIANVLEAAGDTLEARRLYEMAQEMWEELRRDRDAKRVSALLR
jgi:tetratricopeptide (TPR) repeat protein